MASLHDNVFIEGGVPEECGMLPSMRFEFSISLNLLIQ